MCEDFAPNFGDKELTVLSRQCTISHFLSQQGIFDQKKLLLSPLPTLLAWLSPLWLSSVYRHFDAIKVIEAESQAHPLRTQIPGCVKIWQKYWEWCIRLDGDHFEDYGPKLVFDQMAASVSETMDTASYISNVCVCEQNVQFCP
jgi:hypothetical protein